MIASATSITSNFVQFAAQYPEPKFDVKRGKDWIEFGEKNDLPSFVESLIDKSPDHAAILNGCIGMCIGNGVPRPENNPAAERLFMNGEANLSAPNDMNAIASKLFRDLVVHGAAAINVRWTKSKTQIADFHHVPVFDLRIDKGEEDFWISDNWANIKKNDPEFYPGFNTEDGGSQILYLKLPSARDYVYGMPAYWAARSAIMLQWGLSKHYLNRVDNSFAPAAIVSFTDSPLPEEQDKIHKALKAFHAGPDAENNGGFLELYGGGVTVTSFTGSEGPKDFAEFQKNADRMLLSAHRVPGKGSIYGLDRSGGGGLAGSREDILNEVEFYQKTVIRSIQNVVLGAFNLFASINGAGDFKFEIDPFVMYEDDKITTAQAGSSKVEGDAPVDANVAPADNVAAAAMNGSQVDSLVGIVAGVTAGTISRGSAVPLIQACFPSIPLDAINAMINGASGATPINPNITQ